MTMELTGEKSKLDAFIAFLEPLGIVEVCRTGVTAIGRGGYVLKQNEPANKKSSQIEESAEN